MVHVVTKMSTPNRFVETSSVAMDGKPMFS